MRSRGLQGLLIAGSCVPEGGVLLDTRPIGRETSVDWNARVRGRLVESFRMSVWVTLTRRSSLS